MPRRAELQRGTRETNIKLSLNLDGSGNLTGEIPIPFFEHMLQHLVKYAVFDLEIHLTGDLGVDCHHSVEDVGICLGSAIVKALGGKEGIFRYGHRTLPMDETLTSVALDLSGRSYFSYQGPQLGLMGKFGIYDAELTEEFLQKLAHHANMNLHVLVHSGSNRHHIHESIFKALGFALREAVSYDEQRQGVPSTKGSL